MKERVGKEQYEAEYTAVILFLLLVPGKSIYVEFALTTFILLFFLIKRGAVLRSKYVNIKRLSAAHFTLVVGTITLVILGSALRWFALAEINLRDYTEAFRWVPVAIIFAYMGQWKSLQLANFVDVACLYLAIDGFVSICQFLNANFLGVSDFAQFFYNSAHHYREAYRTSGRIIGLSEGPGQHGSILLALVTITLVGFLYESGRRKYVALASTAVGLFAILLSQSQTTFIATAGIIALMVLLVFTGGSGKRKLQAVGVAIVVLLAGAFVLQEYARDLRYLMSLFEVGLERNSYLTRVRQWQSMLQAAAETPFLMFIGWGKHYFGADSTATDNEYLFFLLVYGVPALGLYLYAVARFMLITGFNLLRGKNQDTLTILLFYLFAGGLVAAWPTSFLLNTKVMLIVIFTLAGRFWKKKYWREKRGYIAKRHPVYEKSVPL